MLEEDGTWDIIDFDSCRHVGEVLPCPLPLHTQFQAAIILPTLATNLLHLTLLPAVVNHNC